MLLVVVLLNRAAAIGLIDSPFHRIGHFVGIQRHVAVHVTRSATNNLNQCIA